MKKLYLFTFSIFSLFITAQNTGNQAGFVFDENGKPIASAQITIENSDKSTTSAENGYFLFEKISG